MRILGISAVCVLALGACSRAKPASTTTLPLHTTGGMDQYIKANTWTGNFRPQSQRIATLGPAKKNNVYGRVTIVPLRSDTARAQVTVDLSTTLESGASLAWGVYPGRCGSGSGLASSVFPASAVPRLDVMQNGKAHLATEVGVHLPLTGTTYHLNVFWGDATPDLQGVMACANIAPGG